MLHIMERFFLHFVASTFLTMAVFATLYYWVRNNARAGLWISGRLRHLILTSALLVFALATLREPYDIYMGNNSFVKSCFDQLSWLLGAAVSGWGLYRFKNMGDL